MEIYFELEQIVSELGNIGQAAKVGSWEIGILQNTEYGIAE